MEKRMNLVNKDGVVRLPPGFRFHPTDEELVIEYLKRKALCFPLPASIIPVLHVCCNYDPWDLPGELEQERYFFSTRQVKYPNGSRSNRATSSGYWKATGLDKQIMTSRTRQLVGMKKTLVFYKGKPPHGTRTDWIMHEYRLVPSTSSIHNNNNNSLMDTWVLCRIFLKKRGAKKEEGMTVAAHDPHHLAAAAAATLSGSRGAGETITSMEKNKSLVFYDFMAKERRIRRSPDLNVSPASSSSDSSGITEVSGRRNPSSDEETSSSSSSSSNSCSCNSFTTKTLP